MDEKQTLTFGGIRIDRGNKQIFRGKRTLKLTNKAFEVLRYW